MYGYAQKMRDRLTVGPLQTWRKRRGWFWLGLALFLTLICAACSLYTVRPLTASGGQPAGTQQAFDPQAYVNSIWESRVVPTVVKRANDASAVLVALKTNRSAAQKRYGYQEGDGPYTFLVKGSGRVVSVNTTSRNGTLGIDLPPYSGRPDLYLQIGPVILGTAIRDGVGFIHFGQFVNQIQYAEVADALNARAVRVASQIDLAHIKGQMLTFYGVFALADPTYVLVVPVKLAVEGAAS
jgi:predicted lipoprotein